MEVLCSKNILHILFYFLFYSLLFALWVCSIFYVLIGNIDFLDGNIEISTSDFIWPTPGYTTITSPFGFRKAPTTGAGIYHGGIDIGVPTGTNILASFSGKVTFIGFYGANGYTVTISNGIFSANYSHVSPYFLVYVGQYVNQGDIIAKVGPKNVYNVYNNPYKDSDGNPTNGATTGPHLHFSIKKDGIAVNPLNYISSSSSSE